MNRARALPRILVLLALVAAGLAVQGPAVARLVGSDASRSSDDRCVRPADRPGGATARRAGHHRLDHRAISAAEQRRIERDLARRLAGPVAKAPPTVAVTIPVYVHVIQSTSGQGAVTPAQISAQIAELNQDFAGGESLDAASTGFRFALVGTDTYTNNSWFKGSQQNGMRASTRLGGANALNIWTLGFKSLLGVATFPWDYAANPNLDGIRVLHSTLPGGTTPNYNLGKTATHEAGHWLGLFHTFQGGCVPPGDQVADTPFQASPTTGCPTGRDTCTDQGLDPIENYMDYSYDACYNRFTVGQTTRMKQAYTAYRSP